MTWRERFRSVAISFQQRIRGELATADPRLRQGLGFQWLQFNPDELTRRKGGLRVYDKMREDEQVKACMAIKKAAILGPGWNLEPQSDAQAEQALAETLTDDLQTLRGTFEYDQWEMLSALDYGFSLTEKLFARQDNRIRITALKTRAPHDFIFETDQFGNIRNLRQEAVAQNRDLPFGKFIHFTHQSEFDNPYGRSDLREAYNGWWNKVNWVQWWAVFGERLAIPPVAGKHPTGETSNTINTVLDRLERLQASTAITIPEDWAIELIESKRDPKAYFESAINRHDLRIARALLFPDKSGVAGGEVAGGSFSLARSQLQLWFLVIEHLRNQLEAVINEQLIAEMAELEAPTLTPPKFQLLPLTQTDREEIAKVWVQAVTGNVIKQDARDENYIRQLLRGPELTEEQIQERDEEREERQRMLPAPPTQNPMTPPAGEGQPDQTTSPAPTRGRREPIRGVEQFARALPTQSEAERTNALVSVTFWRPLRLSESRSDMAEKRETFVNLSDSLAMILARHSAAWIEELGRRVRRQGLAKEGARGSGVRNLDLPARLVSRTQRAVADELERAREKGIRQAVGEVRRARRDMSEHLERFQAGLVGSRARDFFRNKAFFITDILREDMLKAAKTTLFGTLRGDITERQTLFELDRALEGYLPQRDRAGRIVNVPARLETIARTNVSEAVNEARYATFTDPDLEGLVVALEYSAILDDRVRDNHRAWDGVTLRPDDPRWFGPPDRRPPNGFNCFLPQTKVSGGVLIASRTRYAGQAVKITTKAGRVLHVTANHPVLTAHRGMTPATDLCVGEDLLAYVSEVPSFASMVRAVDPQNAPANAEDVFRALTVRDSATVRFRPMIDDFHGEARFFKSQVDVVAVDRELLFDLEAQAAERISQSVLVASAFGLPQIDRTRSTPTLFSGSPPSASRFPRSFTLSSDRSSAPLDCLPFQPLRFGSTATLDTRIAQTMRDQHPTTPEMLCEGELRRAGLITTDQIVRIDRYPYLGHVYDFQTVSGLVIAEDIVTSNCRCLLTPLTNADDLTLSTSVPSIEVVDNGFR